MEVYFYTTPSNNSPVEKYISQLQAKERATLLDAIEEIQEYGIESNRVTTKHIESKLWEIKLSRHRVFYVVISSHSMVLLHAYTKQSQKAPKNELEIAKTRMKEVLYGEQKK